MDICSKYSPDRRIQVENFDGETTITLWFRERVEGSITIDSYEFFEGLNSVAPEHDWTGFTVSKADLAAALNEIEGFEVTYTPPRKNPEEVVRDLPNGSYFGWDDAPGKVQYFKDSNGVVRNFEFPGFTYPLDSFTGPSHRDHHIVVYGGEDD